MASGETPVLVLGFDQYSVLATVRALATAGYAPWLAASDHNTYAHRSRAIAGAVSVPDPSTDGAAFLTEVAAVTKRLGVAAVVPTMEAHLLLLADHPDAFGGIPTGVPDLGTVERARSKEALPALARAAGLQTPPTARLGGDSSAEVDHFGFPAIVKPASSHRANPDGTISDRRFAGFVAGPPDDEALSMLASGEWLVQPYIPGDLVSVSGVAWRGRMICSVHQIAVRIWPEPAGVSSYARTIGRDVVLDERLSRLLDELGWSGVFQAQFIRDSAGDHFLIDLNPRIYGSIGLAVAAGANLPAIWVDLMLGRQPKIHDYRVGTAFRQEEKDVRAFVRYVRGGGWRWSEVRTYLPRRHTTHAVFSLRDPLPLLASVPKAFKWLNDPEFRAARDPAINARGG